MYAVIRTGGKQCRVEVGKTVHVERLGGEPGSKVTFDEVLLLGGDDVKVGNPTVEGARVEGTVVEQGRGAKIRIFTFKKRQNSNRKRSGHRQDFTAVKIDAIHG
jgi:large subunit ribosomal protein L21